MFVAVRWLDPFRLEITKITSTRDSIIFRRFCGKSSKAIPKGQKKTNSNSVFISWFFRFFFQERLRLHQRSVRKVHGWQVPRGDVVPSQPVSGVSVFRQAQGPERHPMFKLCFYVWKDLFLCESIRGSFCVSKYKHDIKEHGNRKFTFFQ